MLLGSLVLVGCDDDDDPTAVEDPGTIVEVAAEAGSFSTLLTAVEAAGLTATLEGDGPFTVFAPTDAAFAAIPSATLNALLANQSELTAVLTYHVVGDELEASEVVAQSSIQTLNGASLDVEVDGSTVRIGGATVVTTDIPASNGIIHVIDAVLIPGT
jgi:uncharacterized surface protein with fasciclin (FAS1) repeats